MKVKDIIKKQTTMIAIAVILVTMTVIGVSYSIFFDVKKNTNNQVIKAGTLQLNIADITALQVSEPVTQAVGLASTPVSYTVKNTGNLPANYQIYLYAESTNTMDLSKIKISTDGTTAKALTSITAQTVDNKTVYLIDSGNISANTSGTTKRVRVWVDEDSLSGELSSKVVSLSMYVVSEVKE